MDESSTKIIKTKIVSIYGLPGEWKTFFASFLSFFYARVYSNVDFFSNWKKRNVTIKTMSDINNKIKYNDKLGILILDEAWVNVNARRSMSNDNIEYWQLAMYSRKYNINICIISQLERMADVYFREMSSYNFEMHSYYTGPNYLIFESLIKDRYWSIIWNKKFDFIKFANKRHYTYNTLDKSIISKEIAIDDDLIKSNTKIEINDYLI
jgi:hypothetical protein